MSTLVRTEGAASLYRGLMSPVLGYGLIKATAFASYNKAKQITKEFNYKEGQPSQRIMHSCSGDGRGVNGQLIVQFRPRSHLALVCPAVF